MITFLLQNSVFLAISAALLSIFYGIFLTSLVLKHPKGDDKMNAISDAISEGAGAYLTRQYKVVAVIGTIIFVALYFLLGKFTAIGFAIGAIFSAIAGIVGMTVAVKSNIRTAQAAKKGLSQAFSLAFSGGSVTGLMVAGLALLSVSGFYYVLQMFY